VVYSTKEKNNKIMLRTIERNQELKSPLGDLGVKSACKAGRQP